MSTPDGDNNNPHRVVAIRAEAIKRPCELQIAPQVGGNGVMFILQSGAQKRKGPGGDTGSRARTEDGERGSCLEEGRGSKDAQTLPLLPSASPLPVLSPSASPSLPTTRCTIVPCKPLCRSSPTLFLLSNITLPTHPRALLNVASCIKRHLPCPWEDVVHVSVDIPFLRALTHCFLGAGLAPPGSKDFEGQGYIVSIWPVVPRARP